MTAHLYELGDALQDIIAQVTEQSEANEGVIPDDLNAAWEKADGAFDEKVERCVLWLKAEAHRVAACKAEAKRLNERAAAIENGIERMKAYLMNQLERAGKQRVQRPLATVAILESTPSVQSSLTLDTLYRMATDNSPFVEIVPATLKLDKEAVKAAHKRGETLPEGLAVTRGKYLKLT